MGLAGSPDEARSGERDLGVPHVELDGASLGNANAGSEDSSKESSLGEHLDRDLEGIRERWAAKWMSAEILELG